MIDMEDTRVSLDRADRRLTQVSPQVAAIPPCARCTRAAAFPVGGAGRFGIWWASLITELGRLAQW